MGSLKNRLSKKWLMDIQLTSNKADLFESRLQLKEDHEYTSRLATRKDVLEYLRMEEQFVQRENYYLNIFLKYVSYHCNQYKVGEKDRFQAAEILLNFIKKSKPANIQ